MADYPSVFQVFDYVCAVISVKATMADSPSALINTLTPEKRLPTKHHPPPSQLPIRNPEIDDISVHLAYLEPYSVTLNMQIYWGLPLKSYGKESESELQVHGSFLENGEMAANGDI